jgi:mannosyltransferase
MLAASTILATSASDMPIHSGMRTSLALTTSLNTSRRRQSAHLPPTHVAGRDLACCRSQLPSVAPTRVLYVHHRPQLGGSPTSLAALIRHLDSRFEPHVYCPEGAAADLFRGAGARVHPGPVAMFSHTWDNPYRGLRWLILGREILALPQHVRRLDALLRRTTFPIVHLNDSPLLPAAAVAQRRGAGVVWHLRSALAADGADHRGRAIAALIDRFGDAAIAIDEDVAASFPIRLPVTVVHNSAEQPPHAFPAGARSELGLPEDRVLVGFAGYVRRQKGWPQLVEAAGILLAEGLPVHFVIIGGGIRPAAYFRTVRGRTLERLGIISDDERALTELVGARRLEGSFTFLPFTRDVGRVYSALDIVTFPNQGIGLGRPVLEGAAHAKPVVASGSATGAGVLIPDETGILLDRPTSGALADALRRLVSSAGERDAMGRRAAERASVAFDAERNARAVERVYDAVLDAR